jgi:hypothetical protein
MSMSYECVLYKNGKPIDWYDPIVNEEDIIETEKGLHIILGNNNVYDIPKEKYDSYTLNELPE